jgi:putative membrane protein
VIDMLGQLIAQAVVDGFALWLAALVVDGVHFDGTLAALAVTALLFSIVKLVIRPFVLPLRLPHTILTFGLFLPAINALILLLTGVLSLSYSVDGFWAAFLGGLLISLVSMAVDLVNGDLGIGGVRHAGRPVSGGRPGGA